MRVSYTGFLHDYSGFGEAARRTIQALQVAGVDVRPGGVLRDGGPIFDGDGPVADFVRMPKHTETDLHIVHAIGVNFPEILRALLKKPAKTMGLTCWETDRLPASFQAGCYAPNRIVVPTQQNYDVFKDFGIPVDLVPYPILPPVPESEMGLIPELYHLKSTHVFYTMGTWQRRKNLEGVITSVLTACAGRDDVTLVLKVGGGPMALRVAREETASLINALNLPKRPEVIILGELLPKQMARLHQVGTCYISLARGEGFAVPLADACSAGVPIIATGWGGPMDFLASQPGVHLVPFHMTPVVQAYPLFDGLQNWAEPDLAAAQAAIREIVASPPVRWGGRDLSDFSLARVGQRLREVLQWQISQN